MDLTDTNSASADDARIVLETGLDARIASIVEPVIDDLGYRLVRVRMSGQNGLTLQIMAERPDGLMTIADCEAISKNVSPELDVHDPISGAYHLEVSTPGVDRPLVRAVDFERWAGHLAKVEMQINIEGQRRFRGQLLGLREGEAGTEFGLRPVAKPSRKSKGAKGTKLQVAGDDIWLPLNALADANLVMTDELVEAARAMLLTDHPDLKLDDREDDFESNIEIEVDGDLEGDMSETETTDTREPRH